MRARLHTLTKECIPGLSVRARKKKAVQKRPFLANPPDGPPWYPNPSPNPHPRPNRAVQSWRVPGECCSCLWDVPMTDMRNRWTPQRK